MSRKIVTPKKYSHCCLVGGNFFLNFLIQNLLHFYISLLINFHFVLQDLKAHQVLPVYLAALVARALLDRAVKGEERDQKVCQVPRENVA